MEIHSRLNTACVKGKQITLKVTVHSCAVTEFMYKNSCGH